MATITINAQQYVSSDDLFENAPVYCQGTRSGRELIRKKNIVDYVYAKPVDGGWDVSDGKSRKYDKVFFKKSFYDAIPEVTDEKIVEINNVPPVPDIVVLADEEKFRDDQNNMICIETRRNTNGGVYFKAKDVARYIDPENPATILISLNSYTEGIDYIYFQLPSNGNKKAHKMKKELYLTYEGMLRVLFASHSPRVKPFVRWATEKLFVLHMGTRAQKNELVGSVLGVSAQTVKEVFNADRNTLPCIYMFVLGMVSVLRESMRIDAKYPDDAIVAKFGFTKDLARRTGEHIGKYNKIQHVDLKLKHYVYIDPQYMSHAEKQVMNIMIAHNMRFEYDKDEELAIIPAQLMTTVQEQYEFIGKKCIRHISELVGRNKELEEKNKRQSLIHQIELSNEKHLREMTYKDIELKNKDIELLEYKIRLLEQGRVDLMAMKKTRDGKPR